MSIFLDRVIELDPQQLRAPQIGGFEHVRDHFTTDGADREVGMVLPVGCGKSGLIAILPFATRARRVLVVAPNLRLKRQLSEEFDPGDPGRNFLHARGLVPRDVGWESVVLSADANIGELPAADVVVANIQQVAGNENRWLEALAPDFFDLILFDEAHHNVADSWERLRDKFPDAKIVNLSATPRRGDGQQMIGRVIYAYPIRDAMERGYIRQLRAVRVNPRGLRYVEQRGGEEVEIPIEDVRRLGENDAKFRRTILQSDASLTSIVDASIQRLRQMRARTQDGRHKIIASALNETHCRQVVEAYAARGLRVDYVHANRGDDENERVLALLERHEIDVVVQVRMLGEGFDHPYLSVAAVCNVYGSLAPFLQFVGRVMRLAPGAPHEEGVVVFHAGSNIAALWDDLRDYSEADRQYFEELLPFEDEAAFADGEGERELNPLALAGAQVTAQAGAQLEDIPLLENDDDVRRAVDALAAAGLGADVLDRMQQAPPEELQRLYVTRQNRRIAARERLTATVSVSVRAALGRRGLDPARMSPKPPDNNLVLGIKRANAALAEHVGRAPSTRPDWSLEDFDRCLADLDVLVEASIAKAFDAR
ncbi:MAG: DEAD/DEAH box helicase family protein [Candidatus Baltobacteraceae bacterium]